MSGSVLLLLRRRLEGLIEVVCYREMIKVVVTLDERKAGRYLLNGQLSTFCCVAHICFVVGYQIYRTPSSFPNNVGGHDAYVSILTLIAER